MLLCVLVTGTSADQQTTRWATQGLVFRWLVHCRALLPHWSCAGEPPLCRRHRHRQSLHLGMRERSATDAYRRRYCSTVAQLQPLRYSRNARQVTRSRFRRIKLWCTYDSLLIFWFFNILTLSLSFDSVTFYCFLFVLFLVLWVYDRFVFISF